MIKKALTVQLKNGLQARPAALFVQEANRYRAEIDLIYQGKTASAKSIMGVMSLAISQGETIELQINGNDETEAFEALKAFVESTEN